MKNINQKSQITWSFKLACYVLSGYRYGLLLTISEYIEVWAFLIANNYHKRLNDQMQEMANEIIKAKTISDCGYIDWDLVESHMKYLKQNELASELMNHIN